MRSITPVLLHTHDADALLTAVTPWRPLTGVWEADADTLLWRAHAAAPPLPVPCRDIRGHVDTVACREGFVTASGWAFNARFMQPCHSLVITRAGRCIYHGPVAEERADLPPFFGSEQARYAGYFVQLPRPTGASAELLFWGVSANQTCQRLHIDAPIVI